jgi:hypothetical protein
MECFVSCETYAYVNPMTFVMLKINARMVVGTESRFNLTTAMIRSPIQKTGKAYNAICLRRNGQMSVYGGTDRHQINSSAKLTQNILRDGVSTKVCGWRGTRVLTWNQWGSQVEMAVGLMIQKRAVSRTRPERTSRLSNTQ